MKLDLPEFLALRDLVHARTGLMFEDRKLPFVEARLVRRAAAVGVGSARDYYRHLRYQDEAGSEFQAFVEELTTNETYFFRDYPQLECFANDVLPRIADGKRGAGNYTLNVWSAACSTGDEPYTLAIILDACLDDIARWRIRLLASDLDSRVLEAARRGVYTDRAIRDVPGAYLERYFTVLNGQYHIDDRIRRMVAFDQINLIERSAMRQQRGYDVIFCRNVLIYFDDAGRKQVLGHLYDALVPGGFVFLGHSESVGRISAAFEPLVLGKTVVYRKPPTVRPTPAGGV